MTWLFTVQWEILATAGLLALAFVVSAVGLSLWWTIRAIWRAGRELIHAMDNPHFWA